MQQPETTDRAQRSGVYNKEAFDRLVAAAYGPMRSLAPRRLLAAPGHQSLNTTGLVHEAYLRLVESPGFSFQSHDHFLAIASRVMRNVLVDFARARTADKRGGGTVLVE